jgi:hypothetical protein
MREGEPHGQLALTTLLGLLHQTVEAAVASDGELTLRFTDGTVLTVPPHGQYEAWQLRDEAGLLVVCMPGGRLAIWLPTPPEGEA